MAVSYYLGGGVPHNPDWWGGITVRDVGTAVVGLLACGVATFSEHGFIGLILAGGTVALIYWMRSMAALDEKSHGDKAGSALTRHLLKHSGMCAFDGAAGATPAVLGDVTMYGVSPDVESNTASAGRPHAIHGEMGMLLRERHRRNAQKFVTTLIEVGGVSLGVASDVIEDQRAAGLQNLLNHCARASLPMDALELRTLVRPADYSEYLQWVEARTLDPSTPAVASLREVPDTFAGVALYKYTNHVLLRYPVPALEQFLHNQGSAVSGDANRQCALEITEQVSRKLHDYGFVPRRFVSPERYFAYCRQILDPAFHGSRLNNWEIPAFAESPFGDAVIVSGESDEWWHSVGYVGVNGWPSDAVYANLLHAPVVSTDEAACRMIVTHYGLVPRTVARDTARLAAASAIGKEHAAEGTVSTGEEGILYEAAMGVRNDINGHNLGVTVMLRVGVAAPTRTALNMCRLAMSDAMEGCVAEFTWADGDQVRNLMAMLPTGTGFAVTRH